MKNRLLFLLLLASPPAPASEMQSHAAIRARVMDFVQEQTQAIPGKVSFVVGDIDPRIVLPTCNALEVFLPAGSQMMGKTNIGVRCRNDWSLFVPVQVTISQTMLATSHPLRMGQTISSEDVSVLTGEINQAGVLTDPVQAVGKVVKFSLGAGQVLKQEMLRAPWVVTQGQTVRLVVRMEGLTVSSEGQAMNNAAEGESARVKTVSGKMVTGQADATGSVVIRP